MAFSPINVTILHEIKIFISQWQAVVHTSKVQKSQVRFIVLLIKKNRYHFIFNGPTTKFGFVIDN